MLRLCSACKKKRGPADLLLSILIRLFIPPLITFHIYLHMPFSPFSILISPSSHFFFPLLSPLRLPVRWYFSLKVWWPCKRLWTAAKLAKNLASASTAASASAAAAVKLKCIYYPECNWISSWINILQLFSLPFFFFYHASTEAYRSPQRSDLMWSHVKQNRERLMGDDLATDSTRHVRKLPDWELHSNKWTL